MRCCNKILTVIVFNEVDITAHLFNFDISLVSDAMIHQEAQLPKIPDHAKYLFFSGQPRMLVEFLMAHRDLPDLTSLLLPASDSHLMNLHAVLPLV